MSAANTISFAADVVELWETEYDQDSTVIGFHLGEGDPEKGGQHWNFTQFIPPETGEFEGVCIVKEIQEVTVYGGVRRFAMWADHLVCEFDDATSSKTGVVKLEISYSLSSSKQRDLFGMAARVFNGEGCFEIHQPHQK
ncbi:MAG: hypothetical protein AAGH76_03400 [Pseudomonadota bacterium]